MEENLELEKDSQGRYAYNSEFFGKTGTPYSQADHNYLVTWYDKIPLNEMAFALERTPTSIDSRVRLMRKNGTLYTYKAQPQKPLKYKDVKSKVDIILAMYFSGIALSDILKKINLNFNNDNEGVVIYE